MKVNVTQGLVAVGLTMSLAACGPKLQSVSEQDTSTDPEATRRETISVGVNVSEKGAGFRLAAANSYSMSLDGCVSGLTIASITQNNPSVDVYKFDQNCVVKLNSFVLSGITYVPTAADGFTSYANGDVATFEQSGNPANQFTVRVDSQLNSPISGTEAVSYTFTQLVAGAAENIAKTVVGDAHALSVNGIDAANVDITGVTMTGMTSQGAGEFTFKVDCLTAITGSDPYFCGNNQLTTLKYVLVEDTFGGTLSYAQATALFDNNAGTAVLAANQFTAGNGGFNALVTGPNLMHTKPNMLFVVQSGGASYKYFNVDVSTLTYTP